MDVPAAATEFFSLALEHSDSYTNQLRLRLSPPTGQDQATSQNSNTPGTSRPPHDASIGNSPTLSTMPVLGWQTDASRPPTSPPLYTSVAPLPAADDASLAPSYIDETHDRKSLARGCSLSSLPSPSDTSPQSPLPGGPAPDRRQPALTFHVGPTHRALPSTVSSNDDVESADRSCPQPALRSGKSLFQKLKDGASGSRARSGSPSPVRNGIWYVELRSDRTLQTLAAVKKYSTTGENSKGKQTLYDIQVMRPGASPAQANPEVHQAILSKGVSTRKLKFSTSSGVWAWKGVLHGVLELRPVDAHENGRCPTYARLNFCMLII